MARQVIFDQSAYDTNRSLKTFSKNQTFIYVKSRDNKSLDALLYIIT